MTSKLNSSSSLLPEGEEGDEKDLGSARPWGRLEEVDRSQATGAWGSALVQLCPRLGSVSSGSLPSWAFHGRGCAEAGGWGSFSGSVGGLGTTVKELGWPFLRKMLSEPAWGCPRRLPGREDGARLNPRDRPFCALCLAARSRAMGEPRSTTSPVTGCLRSSSAGWAGAGALAGSPWGSPASTASPDPAAAPLAMVGITTATSRLGLFWLRWGL